MATLPWLAHLSRHELELLVTEIAHDLAERPTSVERDRAEANLGCWQVVAETYGSADAEPAVGSAVESADEPAVGSAVESALETPGEEDPTGG